MDKGDTVDTSEIQWCEHLKIDPWPIKGYWVTQIKTRGCVLVVGQGKIRLVCDACTPGFLEKIQGIKFTVSKQPVRNQ